AAVALALVPVDGDGRRRGGGSRDRRLPPHAIRRRVGPVRAAMTTTKIAPLALLAGLALQGACNERQTRLKLTFPSTDAGACQAQTNIKCVNYLEFTAGDQEHG